MGDTRDLLPALSKSLDPDNHAPDWLPPDLQEQAAQRLAALASIAPAPGVVFGAISHFWPDSIFGGVELRLLVPYIVVSLLLATSIRLRWFSRTVLLRMGRVYQVLGGLLVALVVNDVPWPETLTLPSWSPVAIWVLIFPLVVPNRTWPTAIAATVTASMDPLSVWLLVELGFNSLPSYEAMLFRFLPNLMAVVLAVVASGVLHDINKKLTEARQLGSYQLVERLGGGGMGEVWRARHRRLARDAAIKLIRFDLQESANTASRDRLRRRFEREAQLTAQLRSPHTVDLFDFGATGSGEFYYAMELLDGMDLDTLVQRWGPQCPERVAYLLEQACLSLHEAHDRGLVHRDIKPANLFICRQGGDSDVLKVLDFGLVKEQQDSDEASVLLSREDVLVGTPAYLAPEQVRAESIDGRSDLYSLACVGFWLLTGRTLFEANTPILMAALHAEKTPLPVSSVREDVPKELDEALQECLAKQPEARPENALVLFERLQATGLSKAWTRQRRHQWWQEHDGLGSQLDTDPELSLAP